MPTAVIFYEYAKSRGAGYEDFELDFAGDRVQSEKLFVATNITTKKPTAWL